MIHNFSSIANTNGDAHGVIVRGDIPTVMDKYRYRVYDNTFGRSEAVATIGNLSVIAEIE